MRQYYVSAIDGSRVHLMVGPFPIHEQALAKVDEAFKLADTLDPRAYFMAWGTCSLEVTTMPKLGPLNRMLGM